MCVCVCVYVHVHMCVCTGYMTLCNVQSTYNVVISSQDEMSSSSNTIDYKNDQQHAAV